MDLKRLLSRAGIAILIVLIVYGWFISIGPWRERGSTSDYYSRMASAFRKGQLELEEKPDPALLALPNPYDHQARKGIPLLGDASLYEGKYYLYFGPFPSLPLAAISAFYPVTPGDQLFVYVFLVGLFIIQSLLFLEIIQHFFENLPGWITALGILLLGLTGPFTRMLSHPFIHEAAIAGGQLLFTLGFYAAFQALKSQPIHLGKLMLASLFWAFTAATRTPQLIPIGFMVVFTSMYIAKEYRNTGSVSTLGKATLALIGPLVIGGGILAWYNWARFDSIFEFGLYYQLAAFNLQANYDMLFSKIYVIQNMYNYFFHPFEMTGVFPFIHPLPGPETPVLSRFELPNLYAVEGRFAGALVSTPFLLFAFVPVVVLLIRWAGNFKKGAWRSGPFGIWEWTVLGLLGASIAGALPTLLLFYVGFRYETEFIASLTLLSLIGACQIYSLTVNTPSHTWTKLLSTGLALASILMNLVLSYGGIRG